MGQACQRRSKDGATQEAPASTGAGKSSATASAEVAKPIPAKPKTAASRAGEGPPLKAAPKRDPKKYTTDYSRFDNIVDSDDEKEKEKSEEEEDFEEERQGFQGYDGSNPSEVERYAFTDEMMELCRKQMKDQQGSFNFGKDKDDTPKNVKLPPDYKKQLGVISVKELSKYTCSNDRMLVSVYGDIFDVSSRPDVYGYGPKSFLCGRDITWGVITGNETADNCNRFYDIFKLDQEHLSRYLQILCRRLITMEEDFGESVGRLDKFTNERALPPAPKEEIDECKQQ